MTRSLRLPAGLAGPIAFLAVLAIASGGWSAYGITAPVTGPSADSGMAPTAITQLQEAVADRAAARDAGWEARSAKAVPAASGASGGRVALAPASKHSRKPVVLAARSTPKPDVQPSGSLGAYHGANHFWIPSLGMSYSVHVYACGRTSTPANYIYHWGCAGSNNVYLLGHAYSVMKPLHDLYVRGGLHVGMVAIYADGAGRIRAYQVTEWRVVRPTQIAWQIASQPVPSMTLQTCIGRNSEYRLNVRLVAMH